jgi:hypothetical protein
MKSWAADYAASAIELTKEPWHDLFLETSCYGNSTLAVLFGQNCKMMVENDKSLTAYT